MQLVREMLFWISRICLSKSLKKNSYLHNIIPNHFGGLCTLCQHYNVNFNKYCSFFNPGVLWKSLLITVDKHCKSCAHFFFLCHHRYCKNNERTFSVRIYFHKLSVIMYCCNPGNKIFWFNKQKVLNWALESVKILLSISKTPQYKDSVCLLYWFFPILSN